MPVETDEIMIASCVHIRSNNKAIELCKSVVITVVDLNFLPLKFNNNNNNNML